jgi:YfiH family protein
MPKNCNWLIPNWPAPKTVVAFTTFRSGGVSLPPFDSFNLATHVGDNPKAVQANRVYLHARASLPSEPLWLEQIHGIEVAEFTEATLVKNTQRIMADAVVAFNPNEVCAVLTADCLPILLCDHQGTRVSAIHAGWRGLAAGVIEAAVKKLATDGKNLLAWLGPAIGPRSFIVKEEVFNSFKECVAAQQAFKAIEAGTWLADLYQLARLRLNRLGITQIFGGEFCTYREQDRFFSYRRSKITGRMASLIWLKS